MAPTQHSMKIGQDIKTNITAKASISEVNNSIVSSSKCKSLRTASDYGGSTFPLDEQSKASKGQEDVTVDACDATRTSDIKVSEKEDPDATEYSSSFADSVSENENCSGLSDVEVESKFYGDNRLMSVFDGFNCMFPMRKKKLTTHWRSFIRPLMWRCKWTELRIKEFESQASKYSKEIARYDQMKHLALDQLTLEEFGSRSLPFASLSHRAKALKRRKRKRVEDSADLVSYMSHHNLFSYIENKRSDPDGNVIADDFCNPVITEPNSTGNDEPGANNGWSFLEDNNLLEDTLCKIEIIHSRVQKLKVQLDLVISKNAEKFSSFENLSHLLPSDLQTSSVRSPASSAGNGDTISVGGLYTPTGHVAEFEIGDMAMPESAVSSFGEDMPIPDIIESTAGHLSSADVSHNQPQSGDSCEDIVDNIFMHNQPAEVERHPSIKNHNLPTEKEPERSGEEVTTLPKIEPDAPAKPSMIQEQSVLGSCLASKFYIPKNKRKRGERKAGSGTWSRQHPGEPDSQ